MLISLSIFSLITRKQARYRAGVAELMLGRCRGSDEYSSYGNKTNQFSFINI